MQQGRAETIAAALLAALLSGATPSAVFAEELEERATLEILPFRASGASLDSLSAKPSAETTVRIERTRVAEFAMAGVLAATLVPYQYIQIVARSSPAASHESPATRQPDFSVRGFVEARGETVLVNAFLQSRATKGGKLLRPITMQFDHMNTWAEDLALVVAREIALQKGIRLWDRSIAVACIRDPDSADESKYQPQLQARAVLLARNLAAATSGKLIIWRSAQQSKCESISKMKEIASRDNADAIVALGIRPRGTGSAIRSALYIAEQDQIIPMPDVPLVLNNLASTDSALTWQMKNLFGAILKANGEWQTTMIPAGDVTATKYLELATRTAASDVDGRRATALTEYFLMMAVSRPSGLRNRKAASAAYYQLARIRIGQNRLDEAASLLQQAINRNRGSFEIGSARAEIDVQRGDYPTAIKEYRELVSRFPTNEEAYQRLAALLNLTNDYSGAKKVYRDLLRVARTPSAAIYRELAKLSQTEDDQQEAIKVLEEGIQKLSDKSQKSELKRELASLYADFGRAKYLSGDDEPALELFGKSISIEPLMKAYFYRGINHYAMAINNVARRGLALADFKDAVKLAESVRPTPLVAGYVWSRIAIVELNTLQGSYREAIAEANSTLDLLVRNKDTAYLEPIVRLIRLAAEIAIDAPEYRGDVEVLAKIKGSLPRRYDYGSFSWDFKELDAFVRDHPAISDSQKDVYRQISEAIKPRSASNEARK